MLFGVDLKHYQIDDYQGSFGAGPLNLVNPVYGDNSPSTARRSERAADQKQARHSMRRTRSSSTASRWC